MYPKPVLCRCVSGADGSAEDTAALQQAALYIANLFFLMSDTLAPVVESKKLSAEVAGKMYFFSPDALTHWQIGIALTLELHKVSSILC